MICLKNWRRITNSNRKKSPPLTFPEKSFVFFRKLPIGTNEQCDLYSTEFIYGE